MSAAVFARFSLPVHFLSLLKRTTPSGANNLLTLADPRALSRAAAGSFASRRPTLIRSMSAEASPDELAAPKSVNVNEAHELLKAGHRYLDVRTAEEFRTGHAIGAINLPYMVRAGSGMSKNPSFMQEVSSTFANNEKIIVGCLSGKRSLMAASELAKAGFTDVIDIEGGYSAWSQNGLPMEK